MALDFCKNTRQLFLNRSLVLQIALALVSAIGMTEGTA